MPLPRRTSSFVPVTKIVGEKSTIARRSALAVVEPHSRSMAPLVTCSKRLAGVTGTYSVRIGRRRCRAISSTTTSQMSSE